MQKRIALRRIGILCAIAALLVCCGIILSGCQQEEKTIEVSKPYAAYLYNGGFRDKLASADMPDMQKDSMAYAEATTKVGIELAQENLKEIGATDIEVIDKDQTTYVTATVSESAWNDFIVSRRDEAIEYLKSGIGIAEPGTNKPHLVKPTNVEINDELTKAVITVDDKVFSEASDQELYPTYASLRLTVLNPLNWLVEDDPNPNSFNDALDFTIQDADGKVLMNNETAQNTKLPVASE